MKVRNREEPSDCPQFDVKRLASLAQLTLTPHEYPRLETALAELASFCKQLNEIDTGELPPLTHLLFFELVSQAAGAAKEKGVKK